METVLLSTLAARVGTHVIDRVFDAHARRARKGPSLSATPTASSSTTDDETNMATDSVTNTDTTSTAVPSSTVDESSPCDEDDASSVEAKLCELRALAQTLTSSDDLVRYARVTRRANRLEKRLKELRGPEADTYPIDRLAQSLASMGPSGQSMMSGRVMAKLVVRTAMVVMLWYAFSQGRVGPMRGQVVSFDCSLARPLAFFLRRQPATCGDDWACAAAQAHRETCSVSFVMASALCNAALGLVADIVARWVPWGMRQ